MKAYRIRVLLAVVAGLLGLSGAHCPFVRSIDNSYGNLPPVLPPAPTRQQALDAVNANSGLIQAMSATDATLSGTGFPSLKASIAYERPRRFRVLAGTGITGPEVDLGSNDQAFWFWVKRSEPAALYYCRHEEFAASPMRRQLPVDPYWMIEALGVVQLDPAGPHSDPIPVAGGKFEIHTTRETTEGPATRVTVIDGARGVVLEQRAYDARRQLVAVAAGSKFARDPLSGAFYPTVIDLKSPPGQFALQIRLGGVQINRPAANPEQLFAMPQYSGWPAVDLCRMPGGMQAASFAPPR